MPSMIKRISICGTKPITAPTPPMMPSPMRPTSQPAVPMLSSHAITGACIHSPTNTSLVKLVTMSPMVWMDTQ